MNVTVENLSPIKKKLSLEIAAETVAVELENAYKKIAKTADVKGFRKGKVPREILRQHYGSRAQYDATGPLINNSLYKALLDNKIEAVSQPEVVNSGVVEEGKSFSYEAEVEVRPEIVAKDYSNLNLEKEKFSFDESVVEKQLEQMANSKMQLEVTSRKKARDGDTVVIDFEGFINDTPFENGSAKDFELALGSNSFIPGFESQLVGMKRDQEKEVDVTFPEGYGAKDLAGKPAKFKVLVKEIKEKNIPEINDAFAKEFEAESLDQLKEQIKEHSMAQEKQRIEGQLQENMMNALVANNAFDVPEGMIKNQLLHLKDNFTQKLKEQGMTLEMLGMNDETFFTTYRDMATQQVKGELILDAIATQEEIVVEDSAVEEKMQAFADQSNVPLEQVQKYFENAQAMAGLKGQILQEKTSRFLLESATITEVEPQQPEQAVADDSEKEES
ncbi:trigger factor [uncultured Desulfuromusa sp.]|uniref:trigger factor n=1 Tax=uncultured Desulfuromusa sp. TaxID=219183 RepID=UPI002AA7F56E|nr:trigger factor [uncultured Desulfuromusa sp.]